MNDPLFDTLTQRVQAGEPSPLLPPGLHLEFFPKQPKLQGKGLANLIKLPLGVHRRTGYRSRLLDDQGQPLSDELAALRTVTRLPRRALYLAIEQLKALSPGAPAGPAPPLPARDDQPPLGEPTEPGDFVLDQPPPPPSGDPAGQETALKPATDSPGANASANDTQTPQMGVYLNETGRKVFLVEFFRRLREQLFYPPRSASMELRDIVREQVYHLARVIEGRQPDYLPFIPS